MTTKTKGAKITFGDFIVEQTPTKKGIAECLNLLHNQAIETIPDMMKLLPEGQEVVIGWTVNTVRKGDKVCPPWNI